MYRTQSTEDLYRSEKYITHENIRGTKIHEVIKRFSFMNSMVSNLIVENTVKITLELLIQFNKTKNGALL